MDSPGFLDKQVYSSGCDIFCQTNVLFYGKDGNSNSIFGKPLWNKIFARYGVVLKDLDINHRVGISLDALVGVSNRNAVVFQQDVNRGFSVADSTSKTTTIFEINQDWLYDTILLARELKEVGCGVYGAGSLVLLVPENLILYSKDADSCEKRDVDNFPISLNVINFVYSSSIFLTFFLFSGFLLIWQNYYLEWTSITRFWKILILLKCIFRRLVL